MVICLVGSVADAVFEFFIPQRKMIVLISFTFERVFCVKEFEMQILNLVFCYDLYNSIPIHMESRGFVGCND